MKNNKYLLLIVLGLSLSALSLTTLKKENMTLPKHEGFAVVELFTSEGCSSCPPADKVVAELAAQYPKDVYILSFHVDYWNYLGWKDVFSKPEFTKRQNGYANQFQLNSIYTPQVVVNGKHEFVGSNKAKLQSAITQELENTAGGFIALTAAASDDQAVSVSYKADVPTSAQLNIALVQKEAETIVKRGENGGRKLQHINVVRDFTSVAVQETRSGSAIFRLPAGLSKQQLKVIAYLQGKNGAIIAAKELPLQ